MKTKADYRIAKLPAGFTVEVRQRAWYKPWAAAYVWHRSGVDGKPITKSSRHLGLDILAPWSTEEDAAKDIDLILSADKARTGLWGYPGFKFSLIALIVSVITLAYGIIRTLL